MDDNPYIAPQQPSALVRTYAKPKLKPWLRGAILGAIAGGATVLVLTAIAVTQTMSENPHMGHYYLEIGFIARAIATALPFAIGGAVLGAFVLSVR